MLSELLPKGDGLHQEPASEPFDVWFVTMLLCKTYAIVSQGIFKGFFFVTIYFLRL